MLNISVFNHAWSYTFAFRYLKQHDSGATTPQYMSIYVGNKCNITQ